MTRAEDIHNRRWGILGVLCLSLFVIVMDNTIVNVALPSLVRELGATTSQLQWIVDSYTLVFAGLLLSFGALGDRFGRKGALTSGMAIFGLASLAAALSTNAGELIAARVVMGVGAALIMPATLSILTNVFTIAKERAVAIALWSAIAGAAVALGPVTGGFLLDHFAWGSVFMVNVPIVIGAVIAGWLIVPTSRDPAAPRVDVVGVLLSIVGLIGLVYTIIEAPRHGWTSVETIAGFVGSLAVLAIFIAFELRHEDPMLDVRFFQNPRFTAASVSVTLVSFALFGFIFMSTQYLQFVMGYSPLSAGVHTIPFALAVMVMAPRSAKLVDRFGTKRVVATGMFFFAVGLVVASTSTVSSGYGIVLVAIVLMGSGMGLTIAPATESIMGSLPKEKAGVGSAVNDTTRELGGALGVAVVGSLLSSVYTAHLTDAAAGRLPQPALDAATSSVGAALAVAQRIGPTAEPLVTAARQAFVDGMVIGSRVTAVVAVIGALVALEVAAGSGRRRSRGVRSRDGRDQRGDRRSGDRHARAGCRRSVDRIGNDMRTQRGGEVRVGRLAPRCCRDEGAIGVRGAVEQWLHRLPELVARDRSLCAVAVGPGDRAEPVVALEHSPSTLAEHLDAAQARPRQHVVPDRRERADRAGLETERDSHRVLDAGDPVERGRARRDDLDAADEELEHVDVVHRVLEQRACARLLDVTSPRRGVVALDRDELIVSEHDAHHRSRLGSRDDVSEPKERGRASQHEPDLVGDTRSGDRLGHRSGPRLGRGEWLLAEDREPSRASCFDEPRMLGGPSADVDRVAAVEDLVLRAAGLGGPTRRRKPRVVPCRCRTRRRERPPRHCGEATSSGRSR